MGLLGPIGPHSLVYGSTGPYRAPMALLVYWPYMGPTGLLGLTGPMYWSTGPCRPVGPVGPYPALLIIKYEVH